MDDMITLAAIPPFDLHLTVNVLRRRPSHRAEVFQDCAYRHIFMLEGSPRLIEIRQIAPEKLVARSLDDTLSYTASRELANLLTRTLGLQVDLTALQEVFARDERLAPLMERVAGMKPPRFESLWVTLLGIVPFQQVSLDAGTAILNRLLEQLGPSITFEGREYYTYPSVERFLTCDTEILRTCGLSLAKIRTLHSAAEQIVSGTLSEEEIEPLSDAAALARLEGLYGVGPWSAHIVLLRGFRRLSVFPPGDSGVNRNLQRLFNVSPAEVAPFMAKLLDTLGPWRGYLYFVLLAQRLAQE